MAMTVTAWVIVTVSLLVTGVLAVMLYRCRRCRRREQRQFRHVTDLLRKSESHLQAVVDSTRDGIICIDGKGIITDFNPGAEHIFGYNRGAVIGRHINIIIPDTEKDKHAESIHRATLSEHKVISVPRQLYGKHRNGSLVPVQIALNRMQNSVGARYVGVVRDVTDLVTERNNLSRALREARDANQAKDRLLSAASHELRTPLNAILGFSELLMQSQSNIAGSERRDYLRDIHTAAELLLLLVNDVLDMAKIHCDRMEVNPQAVELTALVERSVRTISTNTVARDIAFHVQLPVQCWVWADEKRLQQVLLNLLSNACKYNRPQGEVSVSLVEAEQANIRLEVSDTGMGVTPEQEALLFMPFGRVQNGLGRIEGTGLGLSICKSLVESMGGDIGYRANPDSGSTFYFTIPVSESPCPDADRVAEPVEDQNESYPLDALYVEDNPINERLMRAVLERLGVTMTCIDNAEDALAYLERESCDVVLMDINLPGMSGEQAARAIRRNPRFDDIPVIAVSASVDQVMQGDDKLFQAYIGKPFKLQRVRRVLKQAVVPPVKS